MYQADTNKHDLSPSAPILRDLKVRGTRVRQTSHVPEPSFP